MNSIGILKKISESFFKHFSDFKGLYHFGPRTKANYNDESDYDIILVFEELDYEKELAIAHIINKFEFEHGLFIDYKTFTQTGKKSIEYIRKNINPIFIEEAIDNGIFYGNHKEILVKNSLIKSEEALVISVICYR